MISKKIDLRDILESKHDFAKLLSASLAILTTTSFQNKTPYEVIDILVDLANQMYHEEEYLKVKNRRNKIEKIKNIHEL
jgi:hypothetical protein